jgi:hypothetical protein
MGENVTLGVELGPADGLDQGDSFAAELEAWRGEAWSRSWSMSWRQAVSSTLPSQITWLALVQKKLGDEQIELMGHELGLGDDWRDCVNFQAAEQWEMLNDDRIEWVRQLFEQEENGHSPSICLTKWVGNKLGVGDELRLEQGDCLAGAIQLELGDKLVDKKRKKKSLEWRTSARRQTWTGDKFGLMNDCDDEDCFMVDVNQCGTHRVAPMRSLLIGSQKRRADRQSMDRLPRKKEKERIFRVLAGRSSFVVLIIIIIIINISHTPSLTDCHVRTTCRKFHWLLKPLA